MAQAIQKTISRRDFLRGDFQPPADTIRPPWSVPETDFRRACNRCGECVTACPEHIILPAPDNYPEIRFDKGGCSFCGDCRTACATGALRRQDHGERPWRLRGVLLDTCISLQGVACRACGEVCEPEAIRFLIRAGGREMPRIDAGKCTGCGFCIRACPVQALAIQAPSEEGGGSNAGD